MKMDCKTKKTLIIYIHIVFEMHTFIEYKNINLKFSEFFGINSKFLLNNFEKKLEIVSKKYSTSSKK